MEQENRESAMRAEMGIQGGLSQLNFNPDDYRHHLDDTDLTPEQQDELLFVLFDIMRQFVDWGFNLHPVQAAQRESTPSIDMAALIEHWAETSHGEDSQ